MNDTEFRTENLGCAAYLHAKKYTLKTLHKEKSSKLSTFIFEKTDGLKSIREATEDYFSNKPVNALDHWISIKTLKTMMYERMKS